jgi:hypothetical protein
MSEGEGQTGLTMVYTPPGQHTWQVQSQLLPLIVKQLAFKVSYRLFITGIQLK